MKGTLMAEDLLDSLKIGHQTIIRLIDQLQGLARSYLMAKPFLREFRETLLNYFSRQNEEMFSRLNEFYKSDRENLKMIEFLAVDLKEIKIKFLIFLEKHSGELGDMSARTFPRDLNEFARALIDRINVEEEYLFPLLERLPAAQEQ